MNAKAGVLTGGSIEKRAVAFREMVRWVKTNSITTATLLRTGVQMVVQVGSGASWQMKSLIVG